MDKPKTIYDGPFHPFKTVREDASVARHPDMAPERLVHRVLMFRECNNTRRCHTLPHVGEYTVGKHVADALTLLLVLKPDASRELILALILHDVPERWLGDLPAPAKWFNDQLGIEYRAAEAVVTKKKAIQIPILSQDDAWWLDVIDRLEFWLWCHDQLALGNRNILGALGMVNGWFEKQVDPLPNSVYDFMTHFEHTRTPEV